MINKKQLGANDLDITKINEYLMSYLNSQEAKNILTQEMTSIIQSTNIETQISQIMSQYMQSSMQIYHPLYKEVFKKG